MKLYKLYEEVLGEGKIKKGSPEELLELLKYLPDDENAKYISSEIFWFIFLEFRSSALHEICDS